MLYICLELASKLPASTLLLRTELLYKRKARLPVQVATSSSDNDDLHDNEIDPEEHMKEMLTWAEEVDTKAKQNIRMAQQTQKKQYDAKHRPPLFKSGDKVCRVYNARKDTRKGKSYANNNNNYYYYYNK